MGIQFNEYLHIPQATLNEVNELGCEYPLTDRVLVLTFGPKYLSSRKYRIKIENNRATDVIRDGAEFVPNIPITGLTSQAIQKFMNEELEKMEKRRVLGAEYKVVIPPKEYSQVKVLQKKVLNDVDASCHADNWLRKAVIRPTSDNEVLTMAVVFDLQHFRHTGIGEQIQVPRQDYYLELTYFQAIKSISDKGHRIVVINESILAIKSVQELFQDQGIKVLSRDLIEHEVTEDFKDKKLKELRSGRSRWLLENQHLKEKLLLVAPTTLR